MKIRESCGCLDPAVERAKTGLITKAGTTIKTALAASRERILVEIREKIPNLSTDTIPDQVQQLLNAFYTELIGERTGTFLAALDTILRQVTLTDGDVSLWQEVISLIRRNILPHISEDQKLFFIEDIFQQGRVMITERTRRAEGYRRLQSEQWYVILSEINQALVTISNVDELITILTDGLQRLKISSCYISLYENPATPLEQRRLVMAYKDGHIESKLGEQHFSSRQLVPKNVIPQGGSYIWIVKPLYFDNNQLGIAIFEAGPKDGMVYETLRGQLSSAFWAITQDQYLKSLYDASSSILSLQEPQDILKDIIERACVAVGAKWANIILTNKEGQPERLTIDENRRSTFSTSMLINNEPILINDTHKETASLYQQMSKEGIGAAGCFPLLLRGQVIGAMWIFFEKPHQFFPPEVNALNFYVNQVAIAYDNDRRMKELKHLHLAAQKLAGVDDVQEVLKQIVQSAREVLQANTTVLWPYDNDRGVFIPSELVAEGIAPDLLEKLREDEPGPDGVASILIEQSYLQVTDVNSATNYSHLNISSGGFRKKLGVQSYQGIALKTGGETLGILYINYQYPQQFEEADKSTLEAFAYHAALALKKARLLQQVNRVHNTTRIIAKASVLNNLQQTLKTVVEGLKSVLFCDAVLLYVYNQFSGRLEHPPTIVDVYNIEAASRAGKVLQDSIVYRMLQNDKPYIVDNIKRDPLFRDRRFAKDEHIASCVAIPLLVAEQRVGVLFVNYRTLHRFVGEEVDDIELFAHQAAVAIRAAQLHDEIAKRTAYLQTFYEASEAFSSTLALDEILNRIAEQAWLFTGRVGEQATFSDLAIVEENKLSIKAAYPQKWLPQLQAQAGEISLEKDKKNGVTGRAVRTKQSQLVDDVTRDSDYIGGNPQTHSELAVPIIIGNRVIGVINVEHQDYMVFDEEDQRALEALAAQAAIVLEKARLFTEIEYRALQLDTASKVARDATATLNIGELLNSTVRLISERFAFYHAGIFLLDTKGQYAVLQAASSEDGQNMLKQGYKLEVNVGIVGFVAQSGKPRIALNVGEDSEFFNNPYLPNTRSEMALPLTVHDRVIGVLDVQSIKAGAFTEADKDILQILADQLSNAIENARQYKELEQTKGIVGSRTALAWMGMASSAWRHSSDKHARTIVEQIDHLRADLTKATLPTGYSHILERLSMIQRLARQIEEKPITPPLSSEEGVDSISLNSLIQERVKQLWENEPYKLSVLRLDLKLDNSLTVRVSSEWLRRALDILIDNAVYVEVNSGQKQIVIETCRKGNQVEIFIHDNGKGIPKEEIPELFLNPIKKPQGSHGLGVGLLMAQVIVQVYGGEIGIFSTSLAGTTMFIRLPLEV